MRQLLVQVPEECGDRALAVARECDATNVARLRATDADGNPAALVLLHVSNARVGPIVDALGELPGLRVSLIPAGALALRPPADEIAEQVTDVAPRSPLEVFVAGLQSIGSWKGFLAYAVAGAVVAWLGMFTNTAYLLVGAMLIAPFAGPALNAAIATARGDWRLLWRSLARYGAALVVTSGVAALLSLLFRQDVATSTMASVSTISTASLLLPLTAGAAGALQLSQGDRNSLVSGAAPGMLIASSLAPPAALVGMAGVSGDTAMLPTAVFLLALQLVGINLGGAIVFRLFGLTPRGPRYDRGRNGVRLASAAVTLAGLAALLAWQFGSAAPELERDTVEQRMRNDVMTALDRDGEVDVVEANVRFTRAQIRGQNSLLAVLYVQRRPAAPASDSVLRERVARRALAVMRARDARVAPRVAVTVLAP